MKREKNIIKEIYGKQKKKERRGTQIENACVRAAVLGLLRCCFVSQCIVVCFFLLFTTAVCSLERCIRAVL